MTVIEYINSIRPQLNDMNKSKFSDFDILTVINSITEIMNSNLVRLKSYLLIKNTTLTPEITTREVSLPDDFVSIVIISASGTELTPSKAYDNDGYEINGNTLKAAQTTVNLVYRAFYPQLKTTDTMWLPAWLRVILTKYVVISLLNQLDKLDGTLMSSISTDMNNISSSGNYSYIDREVPFTIS